MRQRSASLPLPPLAEQCAIADFLDRETAKLDTLVAKKRTLIERLKEKRSALISRTVTRGLPPDAARAAGLDPHPKLKPSGIDWLGDVPTGWAHTHLKRIVTVSGRIGFRGYTTDDLVDEGEGALALGGVNLAASGRLDLSNRTYLSWDHFGRRPLMLISLISAAALAALVASLDTPAFLTLLVVLFLLDGAIAPLYALGVGQTNDYTAKQDFVAASAGLLFAWGLGSAIGPTVAGFVMGWLGPFGLFWFMVGGLSLIATFVTLRILVRRALSAREQSNYVAVPMTAGTYGAPELDPRAEPHHHPQKIPDL